MVRVDPTKVFTAILVPSTINASSNSKKFIIIRIVPGEKGRYAFKITEIPLVPPSKSECGNINKTVPSEYNALPITMNK